MDFEQLVQDLDQLSSGGIVLSIEKKASLQLSLVLLQKNQKLRSVKFWGVVKGIQGDYYIAQGVGDDELKDRQNFYSRDCIEWNILPHVDEGLKRKSAILQGRFTGDPSYVNEHTVTQRVGEGDNTHVETSTVEMKEEDRLAAVVTRISEEVAIFPQGAYLRTPLNQVIRNKSFQGLSLGEAQQLKYYCHFTSSELTEDTDKSITQATQFLPNLAKDTPRGCWSIQLCDGGALVLVHNLHWIGMVAYHKPTTASFGYCYCGTGERNPDLLFML